MRTKKNRPREINVSLLGVRHLSLSVYYEIMEDENYNALIFRGNYNSMIDEENAKKSKEKKDELLKKIKSMLPNINQYIEENISSNFALAKPKFYSFFESKYKWFYFSILNYDYLEMELVQKFINEPLVFLQEFSKYNSSKMEIFKFLEDEKIIEFLDFIEKQNSNELLNFFLNNNDFLKRNIFLDLSIIIINSRKNKKLFFDSLSKKYKYYFIYFIYEFIFEKEKLKEIEKNLIPFEINDMPKNLVLIKSNYKGKEIFNSQEYYKNAIKTKNKFLILLTSQNSQFSSEELENLGHFFILWDFLLVSEKSFVIKCFDEFNKKMPKDKNLKIRKFDSQKKEWVEVSNQELEKYRNYQK